MGRHVKAHVVLLKPSIINSIIYRNYRQQSTLLLNNPCNSLESYSTPALLLNSFNPSPADQAAAIASESTTTPSPPGFKTIQEAGRQARRLGDLFAWALKVLHARTLGSLRRLRICRRWFGRCAREVSSISIRMVCKWGVVRKGAYSGPLIVGHSASIAASTSISASQTVRCRGSTWGDVS